jgi:hypothetical protein
VGGEGIWYFETDVGCCADGVEERVVDGVGGYGEGAVDDAAVNMYAKVDFQHVIVLQDDLFGSSVGRPVCADIVQAKSRRERQTCLEGITLLKTLVTSQCSNTVVNLPSKLRHGNTGLGDRLRILADLAMNLCGFAIIAEELVIHVTYCSQVTDLFSSSTLEIFILDVVLDDLTFRIDLVAKDVGECNSRRGRLLHLG